jgi:hypothetical protein
VKTKQKNKDIIFENMLKSSWLVQYRKGATRYGSNNCDQRELLECCDSHLSPISSFYIDKLWNEVSQKQII